MNQVVGRRHASAAVCIPRTRSTYDLSDQIVCRRAYFFLARVRHRQRPRERVHLKKKKTKRKNKQTNYEKKISRYMFRRYLLIHMPRARLKRIVGDRQLRL